MDKQANSKPKDASDEGDLAGSTDGQLATMATAVAIALDQMAADIARMTTAVSCAAAHTTTIAEQADRVAQDVKTEAVRTGFSNRSVEVAARELQGLGEAAVQESAKVEDAIEGMWTHTQASVRVMHNIAAVLKGIDKIQKALAGALKEPTEITRNPGHDPMGTDAACAEVRSTEADAAPGPQDPVPASGLVATTVLEVVRLSANLQEALAEFRAATGRKAFPSGISVREVQVFAA